MDTKEVSSFRDRPLVMEESGIRKWIYAKKPKGKWYTPVSYTHLRAHET